MLNMFNCKKLKLYIYPNTFEIRILLKFQCTFLSIDPIVHDIEIVELLF